MGDVMDINSMAREAWENAERKGWHDQPRTIGDQLVLIHSEVSEALEAYRSEWGVRGWTADNGKPEGFMSELADVVIRIGDLAENLRLHYGAESLASAIASKMAFNATRPYRHGGKRL